MMQRFAIVDWYFLGIFSVKETSVRGGLHQDYLPNGNVLNEGLKTNRWTYFALYENMFVVFWYFLQADFQ